MSKRLATLPLLFLVLTPALSAQSPFVCRQLTPAQIASATAANKLLEEMQRDKFKQARKHAQKAVDAKPTDPFLLGALGTIEFREGDLEPAGIHLNRSNQIYPCIAYVHFNLAKYDTLIGNPAAAQIQLDLSNAFAPGVPEIAAAWRQTHTPIKQAAQPGNQLQRRPTLDNAPNGLEPFAEAPPQYVLPAVPSAVSFTVDKSGPPSIYREGPGGINLPTIDMLVNGKRLRFILNLDDQPITISAAAARQAGIPLSPAPNRSTYIGIAADLQVGNLDTHNVPVTIVGNPANDYGKLTNFTDGSISLYTFSHSLITIDIWNGNLTLAPLPATSPADAEQNLATRKRMWAPFYVVPNGHKILAEVDIGTGSLRLFTLDTGRATSLLSPDAANNAADESAYTRISTAPHTPNWAINSIRIQLARKTVQLSHPQVYLTPQFHDFGMAVDGVLGRDALQGITLTLDFRDHLLQAH